jgi:hypothetical protein
MRLTTDEYDRGLVKWSSDGRVEVRTTATDDPSGPDVWSAPLTDPNGSHALSPPGRYLRLGCQVAGDGPPPFPIRWDRQYHGKIQTLIVDSVPHPNTNIALVHFPTYGIYHRLVVEVPPTLTWDADTALRVGDAIVRLVTGVIFGQRVPGFDHVDIEDNGISVTSGWAGTIQEEGRFIEIVAPGNDEASAELNATAILGLLALMVGSGAIGPIRFSEPYAAASGEPQKGQYRFPISYRLPTTAAPEALDAIDEILGGLLSDDRLMQAARLALHWFERGTRFDLPVDQLTAFFIGIETILNTFASVHGPIPGVEDRKRALGRSFTRALRGILDAALIDRLRNCGMRASTRERFAFYVERRGLDPAWLNTFEVLAEARNNVFHGQPMQASPEHALDARKLLIEMLKREFDIRLTLPWESGPDVPSFTAHWVFADYGYHGG